ncbi:MAG: Nif3-like dinuclear metal center hexameric protein [Chitinophagales bacterium]|nr:Nif3-like dinuclear metal center hexameric protein [Chitinophagales bacterium]
MKIKDITTYLEHIAPLALQESYDNCGLIVGDKEWEVSKVLVTLDCTEAIVDEAIAEGCNLIVAHHPIVFSGLKKINGKNYVERTIIKAIKNDVAIYAIHTNYDNVMNGVNAMIASRLGLTNVKMLSPKGGLLKKLITFIPDEHYQAVSSAVFAAGAGHIGNYSETSFNTPGFGTFRGNEHSNPTIGKAGELEKVAEIRFETIFPAYLEGKVLRALFSAHPYEEVAYDVVLLQNQWNQVGSGMIGEVEEQSEMDFLQSIKATMEAKVVRHTPTLGKTIKKVAICGGSGRFLLNDAIAAGADAFVTADFKYHDFFDADSKIVVADIGHYESEQFTKDLLKSHLLEKFPTFAVLKSKINTNPINYL